ncbi:MAG: hypothetical protein V4490_00110 [Pseudomonadota bacterium]
MFNLIKSIAIIIFMILLQLSIYNLLLKPIITTWGASEKEVSMPMVGDEKSLTITSTRAILIDAPKSDVWKWLMQLGADRNGFYSYPFIEKSMGYKNRNLNLIKPEFNDLKVGDVVRGSIDEKSSIIPYNFRVIYCKSDEAFVLDNWGTFLLEKINDQQTRLVIRTQERKSSNLLVKAAQYITIPLHFIMERRMLIGIKARAEVGEGTQLSEIEDEFWFSGIALSGILVSILVFLGRGIIQSVIIPVVFSVFWLCSLLLCSPIPLYSIGLLLMVGSYILYVIRTRSERNSLSPES